MSVKMNSNASNKIKTQRKIIALLSTGMILGFAIALASAEDSATDYGSSQPQQQQQPQQQPGTVGPEEGGSVDAMTGKSPAWKEARTCIDENGNTIKRGEAGFESCIERMRRQEPGTAAEPGTSSSETSNSGTMGSGTSGPGSGG